MSKGKKPPERSKIERAKPLAYQRRASDDARVEKPEEKTEERATGEMSAVTPTEADAPKMPEAKSSEPAKADAKPTPDATPEAKADAKPVSKPDAAKAEKPSDAKPAADAKPPTDAKPAADAKPDKAPETSTDKPEDRSSRETVTMPVVTAVGTPPAVPGDVEHPTFMPGPKDVPAGAPTDAAKPPGHVPSGDSRSLRRGSDFALIYRQGSAVITRFGAIGTRGQWRVVEYPTPSSASNAYAKECSRFVGEGFSDYRD